MTTFADSLTRTLERVSFEHLDPDPLPSTRSYLQSGAAIAHLLLQDPELAAAPGVVARALVAIGTVIFSELAPAIGEKASRESWDGPVLDPDGDLRVEHLVLVVLGNRLAFAAAHLTSGCGS